MDDNELRGAAHAVLATVEETVDIEAARAVLRDRSVAAATPPPGRRWPLAVATAAALAIFATAGLWLTTRDARVRTVEPPVTQQPVSIPPTRPGHTLPAPTPPPTAPSPTLPPVTGAPAPVTDPFKAATQVAAGADGIQLGLPDGSWVPISASPTSGPAYLVGRFVVHQAVDPEIADATPGPIVVLSAEGGRDASPYLSPGYEVLDAGWVAGRPMVLTANALNDPEGTVYSLQMTDVQDLGRARRFGRLDDDLRTQRLVAAGLGDAAVVALRESPDGVTTMWVGSLDGDELARRELPPGGWSLTVTDGVAWAFSLGADITLDVVEVDLDTLVIDQYEAPASGWYEGCGWPRYGGTGVVCGDANRVVAPRRGPLPSDVEWITDGYRPYLDTDGCRPRAARSPVEWTEVELHPFFGRDRFSTYQFIGYPEFGAGGPFALVGVLSEPIREIRDPHAAINGWPVDLDVADWRLSASAFFDMPDGRQAYLRSWGLDRAMIEQVIGALSARAAGAAIPGFDYDAALGPQGLDLVHEQLPGPVAGFSHQFVCEVPVPPAGFSQVRYTIHSYTGDPLWQFLAVLDRPAPLAVGRRGDTTLVMTGGPESAPSIDDVIAAPADVWLELLDGSLLP